MKQCYHSYEHDEICKREKFSLEGKSSYSNYFAQGLKFSICKKWKIYQNAEDKTSPVTDVEASLFALV